MNVLEFENGFECTITFEGDNETDISQMKIKRTAFDGYGNDILIEDNFYLRTETLENIALGLEAMALKIKYFLNKAA